MASLRLVRRHLSTVSTPACYLKQSLRDVSVALRQRRVTATQLTDAALTRVRQVKTLNAFISSFPEQAMKQAAASDERISSGRPLSGVDGVPIAVKDNYCYSHGNTTAASAMLEHFAAPYTATACQRLVDAGAIIIGKTNMDEFSMGSFSDSGRYGAVVNPLNSDSDQPLTAGGSSGGSAAAVASHCCFAALGSDTGGSVRQPAAFCGVVGVKPSYGRVSRNGLIAYASSLDTPSVLARSAVDAQIILDIISASDPDDATANNTHAPAPSGGCVRVGVPLEFNVAELSETVKTNWLATLERLEASGNVICPVSIPSVRHALPVYYILAAAEASSNLSRYDGVRYGGGEFDQEQSTSTEAKHLRQLYTQTRACGFGNEVQRRVLAGTFLLSSGAFHAFVHKAQQLRRVLSQEFAQAFQEVDVLVGPTTMTTAPTLADAASARREPVSAYMHDVLTVPANLASLPALSLPVMFHGIMPVGIQVIARPCDEATMFRVAASLSNPDPFAA